VFAYSHNYSLQKKFSVFIKINSKILGLALPLNTTWYVVRSHCSERNMCWSCMNIGTWWSCTGLGSLETFTTFRCIVVDPPITKLPHKQYAFIKVNTKQTSLNFPLRIHTDSPHLHILCLRSIISTLANHLQKVTISFDTSISFCLSTWSISATTRWMFREFYICNFH
jgi:hypothetical protein